MKKLFLLIPFLVGCLNLTVVVPGPNGSLDTIFVDTVHQFILDTVIINDFDNIIQDHIKVRIEKGDVFMPGQWYQMGVWYQIPPLNFVDNK
jgi:hypothetical protein